MPVASRSRRRQRGVAMIWYTLMLTTLILPIMGIAVDLTMLYTVQAKLAAAADGAALGAGRLLGTSTGTAKAPVENMAGEFFKANFPTGYWSTPSMSSTAATDNTAANTFHAEYTNPGPGSYQIKVVANVRVPLIFARIFQVNQAAVASTAIATRKSTRIEWVLDRSGSMGGSLGAVKTLTILYAGFASAGVDEMGLVVFGSTGVVAYPNYTKTLASPYPGYTNSTGAVPNTGGPDSNFYDQANDSKRDGSTGCSDLFCMTYSMASGGATGMAEALDLAYLELQKAHKRDLAADLQDARLNTVIFLTDGVPNQVPVYANDPNNPAWMLPACTDSWGPSKVKCKSNWNKTSCTNCTNCTYRSATVFSGANDNRMLYMAGPGQSAGQGSWISPPYVPAETDTTYTTKQWVAESGGTSGQTLNTANAFAGCPADTTTDSRNPYYQGKNGITPWLALAQVPSIDYYGTSMYPRTLAQDPTTPGYYKTTLSSTILPLQTWVSTTPSDYYYWGVAAWTTTDNIGYNMRVDSNQNGRGNGTNVNDVNAHMSTTIYTIGYTGDCSSGSGSTDCLDSALLKRLANTTDSTTYVHDGTQQVGKYYLATDTAGIAAAMSEIMSSVLRLAQ